MAVSCQIKATNAQGERVRYFRNGVDLGMQDGSKRSKGKIVTSIRVFTSLREFYFLPNNDTKMEFGNYLDKIEFRASAIGYGAFGSENVAISQFFEILYVNNV